MPTHRYGAVETMTNAKPGDVLEFHGLNTFRPHGNATIASLERLTGAADVAKYGSLAVAATSGGPPNHMNPALATKVQPDVGKSNGCALPGR